MSDEKQPGSDASESDARDGMDPEESVTVEPDSLGAADRTSEGDDVVVVVVPESSRPEDLGLINVTSAEGLVGIEADGLAPEDVSAGEAAAGESGVIDGGADTATSDDGSTGAAVIDEGAAVDEVAMDAGTDEPAIDAVAADETEVAGKAGAEVDVDSVEVPSDQADVTDDHTGETAGHADGSSDGRGGPDENSGLPSEARAAAAETAGSAAVPTATATATATAVAATGSAPRRPAPDRPKARGPRAAIDAVRRGGNRTRFGREAVGIAVLVVLALICAGLITAVIVKTRHDSAVAAREAAAYTPPPLATPSPSPSGPAVAVIGDGTVTQAASGVEDAGRWPALLGADLDGAVDTSASDGMGYASNGASGKTFGDEAATISADADVVVFVGGVADANVASLSTAKSATDAFASAAKQAPSATVVVVGPVIDGGASTSSVADLRNTLKNAASVARVTWVDPITSKWLSDSRIGASSPAALTAGDERTIATKLAAAVAGATD